MMETKRELLEKKATSLNANAGCSSDLLIHF